MKKKLTSKEQKEAFVIPLFKKNYSLSEIVAVTGIPIKEVKRIVAPLIEELEKEEEEEISLEELKTMLAQMIEGWGKDSSDPEKE